MPTRDEIGRWLATGEAERPAMAQRPGDRLKPQLSRESWPTP
jgi:hypothetical protein